MRWLMALAAAGVVLLACGSHENLPPEPYNLSADSVSGGAELRWEQAPPASRFKIQRSIGDDSNFTDLAWTRGTDRFYRDDDVTRDRWYYYRVAAFYEEWNGQQDILSDYCPYDAVQIQ